MINTSPIGLEEAVEGLTGYEEQDIELRFGGTVEGLLESRPTAAMRAVAYVLVARDLDGDEVKDAKTKAYKHVMSMTMKQALEFFPDTPAEPNPDQPETPAGEGEGSDAN